MGEAETKSHCAESKSHWSRTGKVILLTAFTIQPPLLHSLRSLLYIDTCVFLKLEKYDDV